MVRMVICKECRKEKLHKGHGLCKSCYQKKYQSRICNECGLIDKIVSSNPDVCNKCYQKSYVRPKDVCSKCNKTNAVKCRLNDGSILCSYCYGLNYSIKKRKCSVCGKVKQICTKQSEICKSCYNKTYKQPGDICSFCGKTKKITLRNDEKILCQSCYMMYRRKTDEIFRIKYLLRKRLRKALKHRKPYIDKKFNINYTAIIKFLGTCPGKLEDYHIDHILPLSAFNFNDPIHVTAAFAPENHQWLIKRENLQKNSKYDEEEFNIYIKRFTETL